MAKKTTNPFAKFSAAATKKVFIDTLDYEITYRPLTVQEDDDFNLRLLGDGDPEKDGIDFVEANVVKYERLAKILVDPAMTVEELKQLSSDANEVLIEITNKTSKLPGNVDTEGN